MKQYSMICDAGELSASLARHGATISPERLIELAEARYLPSVAVDGKWPMFVKSEARDWVADNLIVRQEARPFPKSLRVIDPEAKPVRPVDVPDCLLPMAGHVWELPMSSLARGGVIYFLAKGDEVVYVGQTVALHARLSTHHGQERIDFDRAFYIYVPESELCEVEAAFVRVFQPAMNTQLKTPERPGDREIIARVAAPVEMLAV